MVWGVAAETSVSLGRGEGLAQDTFNFGQGNTVFVTGRSEKINLMPCYPAAYGSWIHTKYRSYLVRPEILRLFHALMLKDI